MAVKRAVGTGGLIALASCVMVAVFMRVPALWFLMPRWLGEGLMSVFAVESQEHVNDIEFLSAWLLCFVTLLAIVIVISVMRRKDASSSS